MENLSRLVPAFVKFCGGVLSFTIMLKIPVSSPVLGRNKCQSGALEVR